MEEALIGKMYWGADANEIRGWLSLKYEISGEEAENLIRMGAAARAAAIRKRAFWEMLGSVIVFALSGGFILLQVFGPVVYIGYASLAAMAIAAISFGWFFAALWRFITGKTTGPVGKV